MHRPGLRILHRPEMRLRMQRDPVLVVRPARQAAQRRAGGARQLLQGLRIDAVHAHRHDQHLHVARGLGLPAHGVHARAVGAVGQDQ
ncbi:Uncharacterised protein [Bordetella pertussis]|nr:Uncharacterised protein [Bordetella pertussis]